jgi:hypothetical protein
MITLSHVQVYPYLHGDLPYISLEFEASWAEEGLLALLIGTEVIARGFPGSAQAVDASIIDDGGVM